MSITGNPFLDAFRVLQPDVDVVVLPPDLAVLDLEPSGPDAALAAARRTHDTAHLLLADAGLDDDATVEAFERWDSRGDHVHAHRTRLRAGTAAPEDAVDRIEQALAGAGWSTARVPAATPWVEATAPPGPDGRPSQQADVAVQDGRLVLTVTSAPLRLEEAPA